MNIRPLHESDFKSYIRLMNSFRPIQADISSEQFSSLVRRMMSCGTILVAIDNGSVIGSVTVLLEQKLVHNLAVYGHIEDVIVRKDQRRQGVGTALMTAAIEYTKKEECYKTTLVCSKDVVPFYVQAGFETRGICMSYWRPKLTSS